MTLERTIERDHLAREIVLAYQNGAMDRARAFDGLRRLGWRTERVTQMLDTVEKVTRGRS